MLEAESEGFRCDRQIGAEYLLWKRTMVKAIGAFREPPFPDRAALAYPRATAGSGRGSSHRARRAF
jgi:hypothetical protein